jgi:hypothetical protein
VLNNGSEVYCGNPWNVCGAEHVKCDTEEPRGVKTRREVKVKSEKLLHKLEMYGVMWECKMLWSGGRQIDVRTTESYLLFDTVVTEEVIN